MIEYDLMTWKDIALFKQWYLYAITLGFSDLSAGYAACKQVALYGDLC